MQCSKRISSNIVYFGEFRHILCMVCIRRENIIPYYVLNNILLLVQDRQHFSENGVGSLPLSPKRYFSEVHLKQTILLCECHPRTSPPVWPRLYPLLPSKKKGLRREIARPFAA